MSNQERCKYQDIFVCLEGDPRFKEITAEVPFVGDLLQEVKLDGQQLTELIKGLPYDALLTEMLVQMVRRVDATSLVPNLIGTVFAPEDAAMLLAKIAASLNQTIAQLPHPDRVWDTLSGAKVYPDGVKILDQIYGGLVDELKAYRGTSTQALGYRRENVRTLFSAIGQKVDLSPYQKAGKQVPLPIRYNVDVDQKGRAVGVRVQMLVPDPAYAVELGSITPRWFSNPAPTDTFVQDHIAGSPLAILPVIGKLGNPVLRAVADYLPDNSVAQQLQRLRELKVYASTSRRTG